MYSLWLLFYLHLKIRLKKNCLQKRKLRLLSLVLRSSKQHSAAPQFCLVRRTQTHLCWRSYKKKFVLLQKQRLEIKMETNPKIWFQIIFTSLSILPQLFLWAPQCTPNTCNTCVHTCDAAKKKKSLNSLISIFT